MALTAPYKRTIRPFLNGGYQPSNGSMSFVRMDNYARKPRAYVRGFEILQREVRNFFEYVEPSDNNMKVYSEIIGKLLTSACFEVESNLKAILKENLYSKVEKDMNMNDYFKVEASHHLSKYEVLLPEWTGDKNVIRPFEAWASAGSLKWYQDYNKYKHDRVANAESANFENLLNAWSGNFVLLSSQFFDTEFSVDAEVIGFAPDFDENEYNHGIGGYLKIKYPNDWLDDEKYEFALSISNWNDSNFCQAYSY